MITALESPAINARPTPLLGVEKNRHQDSLSLLKQHESRQQKRDSAYSPPKHDLSGTARSTWQILSILANNPENWMLTGHRSHAGLPKTSTEANEQMRNYKHVSPILMWSGAARPTWQILSILANNLGKTRCWPDTYQDELSKTFVNLNRKQDNLDEGSLSSC